MSKKLSTFSKQARINIADNIAQDYLDNNPSGKTLNEMAAEYFLENDIDCDVETMEMSR